MNTYYLEELSIEDIDTLIEKGECFNVRSKNAVFSRHATTSEQHPEGYTADNSGDSL